MKRKAFLIEFLGALGAEVIEWRDENNSYISGRVIYEKDDPEEIQDFCWHLSEQEVPSDSVLMLAKLINEGNLLSIDKITVNREELRRQFNEYQNTDFSKSDFLNILDTLTSVQIRMVDDGEETDTYFIHG